MFDLPMQGTWLVDGVIAFMLIEGIVLLTYRKLTRRGVEAAALLPNMAAGLCLLLALSAALHAANTIWIALALALAGVAHVLDLRVRWRERAGSR